MPHLLYCFLSSNYTPSIKKKKKKGKLELQYIVDEIAKCYGHLENGLTVSYKVKHILTSWSNNPTFEVFTQEQMWLYAHTKNERQKAFFIIRTNWNKPNSYQLVIDFKIYYAIVLCTKKKWDISMCNMDESQKH